MKTINRTATTPKWANYSVVIDGDYFMYYTQNQPWLYKGEWVTHVGKTKRVKFIGNPYESNYKKSLRRLENLA